MKKTIYNIFSLLFMAASLFAGVSCEEEKPVEISPKFPELVENHKVTPGTELTLTIQPYTSWSISIQKESYEWFKIVDGRFKVQTLSGTSSDKPVTITIWTTDEESFDLRSCEVKMTMDGESQVIAKYTLLAKDRTLELYPAKVNENGSFEYADGGYVYEEAAMTQEETINLVWDVNERKYIFPVMVKANYNWSIEWPEWARADIVATNKVGEVCFSIYGISSKLPYEDTEGVIRFLNGENEMKSFKVKIPGCGNIFSYSLGGYTSLTFDHAQYFHSEGFSTKEPLQGLVYGPEHVRVIVLEKTQTGYVVAETPWLNVEITPWDGIEGADVLQQRILSVSAPRYYGDEDREAMILILPATVTSGIEAIISSLDKYAAYSIPVVQKKRPEEYITFEAESAERESAGLVFARSQEPLLPEKNFKFAEGASSWQYDLSYLKERATVVSPFYITEAYETIVVYDAGGNEISDEDLPDNWLNYSSLGDGLYGQIVMDMSKFTSTPPAAIDGYVVFKDEKGKVLSVVHCFYVREESSDVDILHDVSATMFVNPADASAAGAKIYEVLAGPTYEAHKGNQAPIYKVIFTVDDTSLYINTKKTCSSYSCQDKVEEGPDMVTIDDQVFKDKELYALINKYYTDMGLYEQGLLDKKPVYPDTSNEKSTYGLLKFGPTALDPERTYPGYSKFNMKKVKDNPELTTEVIQFFGGSDSAMMFIFICVLDIPATSEN